MTGNEHDDGVINSDPQAKDSRRANRGISKKPYGGGERPLTRTRTGGAEGERKIQQNTKTQVERSRKEGDP